MLKSVAYASRRPRGGRAGLVADSHDEIRGTLTFRARASSG
ncbi:hypothetical protein [Nonomuraea sp. NPDC050691]